MKYGEFLVFKDWKDIETSIDDSLFLYFGLKLNKIEMNDKSFSLVVEGKLPQNFIKHIDLTGTDLTDFEGLTDDTQAPCHIIPIERLSSLLIFIYGYDGRFKIIPLEKQNDTEGELETEIYYLKRDTTETSMNECLIELIQEKYSIVSKDDDSSFIYSELLELCSNISRILGDKNVEAEIESMK